MTIQIEETTKGDVEQYTLYVNDFPAAHVQVLPHGVHLNWAVYGPQLWPEAKLVLEGLLELSLLADQLTLRSPHEKVRRQKARKEVRAKHEEDDDTPDAPLQIRFGKRNRVAAVEGRPGAEVARRGGKGQASQALSGAAARAKRKGR